MFSAGKIVVQRKERLDSEEKMQRKKMRVDEDELAVRHANQGCRQGSDVGTRHVVEQHDLWRWRG